MRGLGRSISRAYIAKVTSVDSLGFHPEASQSWEISEYSRAERTHCLIIPTSLPYSVLHRHSADGLSSMWGESGPERLHSHSAADNSGCVWSVVPGGVSPKNS